MWAGLLGRVREPFAGAWQRNISAPEPDIITQSVVWSCITLIAQDIGKLCPELIEKHGDIWEEIENSAYSPILRQPNHFQNRIDFYECWMWSKLTRGNTYVLKERDARGVVSGLYILDPQRVQVLVSPRGDVFYQLSQDNLAGNLLTETAVTVPASEIIHDVASKPYHPLCGVPPLVACALPASQSLSMQASSARFFQNNAKPGGVLTAPGRIGNETAERIKQHWESNYGGEDNVGKVAVLGDGLKYEPMAFTFVESDISKQLGWTDERICGVFHVPPFMVGVGPMPTYDNVTALTQIYYQQALQTHIEKIEDLLDKGLGLSNTLGVYFDLDGLTRMDPTAMMEMLEKGKNIFTANEQRQRLNLPKVTGGNTVYRQEQDHSLEALARRDAQPDPFGKTPAPSPAAPAPAADASSDTEKTATLLRFRTKTTQMVSRYSREEQTRVERAG